jgi:asparagine synthase (glutamine-hydrolysing)
MCGIAGWFSKQIITSHELDTVKRMIQRIKHRGPDGEGYILHSHAALGHARLSIIDISNGQQPMVSHDKQFSITFNGEIYNFKQLRDELLEFGHQFHTSSDTEVIMEIYRKYGVQGFSRLRGMYAFSLWDHNNNCGLLARDPLGIKPLFVHHTKDGSIIFASEAKSIFEKIGSPPEIDLKQLHMLINFRYLPGDASLFREINQLPPASVIRWQPGSHIRTFTIEMPEAPQGVTLEHIRDSVHQHMTSDVEVGCYLSGGIDSSTITALAAEKTGKTLRTFTVDAGDDPREKTYAAETAAAFGVQNTQFSINQDITEEFNQLLWHLEVPKINAAQNWQLARSASQYVKVTLSGLGGDELFLGYNMHRILARAHTLTRLIPTKLSSVTGSIASKLYRSLSPIKWNEPERALMMLENLENWPLVYGLLRNVWDYPATRRLIYGDRMLSADLPDAFEFLHEHWPIGSDPVMGAAKFEWRHKMINDLLWQEDRVSMAHGLEVRTPLVDRILYSHVKHLSRDQIMIKGKPKAYMKEVLSGYLPKQILNRPKSGFQVASERFFHSHLLELAKQELTEKTVQEVGLFNYQFVKHVLKFNPSKRLRWHYFILYFIILTHLWVKLFESPSHFGKP